MQNLTMWFDSDAFQWDLDADAFDPKLLLAADYRTVVALHWRRAADHHRGAGDRRWSRHFCNLASARHC